MSGAAHGASGYNGQPDPASLAAEWAAARDELRQLREQLGVAQGRQRA
jgi:hypothetical protein